MIENKLKFQRTLVIEEVKILAGQTQSNILNCGGMQLRNILLPENWTTTDLKFFCSDNFSGTPSYVIKNFDGVSIADFAFPGTTASSAIPLIPYFFDSLSYVQLTSVTPQASDVIIKMVLQPIYQGIHA